MTCYEYKSRSPEETIQIAKHIGSCLKKGDVMTLEGDLGAGKTHFAKGIGMALGVNKIINSPTFTIIKQYEEGSIPFYHMDVYRLEEAEIDELGIEEYLEGNGVCLIEWAEKMEDLLPDDRLAVTIERQSETNRIIRLEAFGNSFDGWCEELQENEDIGN